MQKLIVNVGGMFSGKTTALLQQGERYLLAKKKVAYVKPQLDNRYSENCFVTHKGQRVDAINVPTYGLPWNLILYDVILIDEIQFFDKNVVKDIEDFLVEGKTIIVSGLDMDFEGNGFEVVMQLMAQADKIIKHKAVCQECGEDATFSYRTSDSKELVLLGEKESYIPLCRECFYKKREGQGEEC